MRILLKIVYLFIIALGFAQCATSHLRKNDLQHKAFALEIQSQSFPVKSPANVLSSGSGEIQSNSVHQKKKPVLVTGKQEQTHNSIQWKPITAYKDYKNISPTDSTVVKKKVKRQKFWQRDDWELIRFLIFCLILILLFLALIYWIFGPVGIVVVVIIVLITLAILFLLLLLALLVIKWIAQFGI